MPGITSQVATSDFLNLLTVQLRNQDPIDPVKQEDFISQLSQFSMLEEIEGLNNSFEQVLRIEQMGQGLELVGKRAEYFSEESGQQESGLVERMFTDQGPVDLLINGERVSIDVVSGVTA
ncbi:MAG: flagellar hook capping FlgD N-terminal domain-containing protein [Mariniblastus sp.]